MKEKVVFSAGSIAWTIIVFALICASIIFLLSRGLETIAIIFSLCLICWCFAALWFAPRYISVSPKAVIVNRTLSDKEIPLSEIASIHLCPPTMAERRILGSGGLFGYWGWFSEPSIGKYFAYYGKASDCFLITLRDGRKYLLGCQNAPKILAQIQANLI